jgi:ankyrin repeat protein
MSPWFSRGWTALELLKSRKVKVIFKGQHGGPLIKDLDEEILAKDTEPESPRKEASRIIRRLRNGITTLNDLLYVLGSRSTSWPKDIPLISALLLDVKPEEQQQDTYRNILRKLGKLSSGHLFNNAITMTNGFNWCPVTLFKMPLDSSEPSLSILNNGDVRGRWRVIPVPADLERICLSHNMHPLTRFQFQDALKCPSECRLLAECNQEPVERALLVREVTENRFQYIAAVTLYQEFKPASSWREMTVTILSDPQAERVIPIELDEEPLTMSCDDDETLHSAIWKGEYDTFKELIQRSSLDTPDQFGRRPLDLAAERGNRQMVEDLLCCKADLNAQCDDGQTALHRAAWAGSVDIVKLLLNGTNTMALDKDGNTALHIASQMGFADVVELLITHNVHSKGYYDLTPLHFAAMNGHTAVAELLIDTAEVRAKDMHFGWTPLHCAADSGNERVVTLLIDHGADINAQDQRVGWTPLHFASISGHMAVVNILLQRGARSATKDMLGWTPGKFAQINGHIEIVKLLPNDDSYGTFLDEACWTPLHCRAINNRPGLTKLLTSQLPVVRMYSEKMAVFRTPLEFAAVAELKYAVQRLFDAGITIEGEKKELLLHWAVKNGCRAFTQLLLKAGIGKEAANEDGETPLHLASSFGRGVIAQLLLEAGANKEALDRSEETPLHRAVLRENTGVVRLLIKAGANKDTIDIHGRTPLLYAVKNGNECITRLLVEAGANKDTTDRDDWTPLHWAVKNGHEGMVRLLIEVGANKEKYDKEMYTPLSHAAEIGHEAIVQLLVESDTHKRIVNGKALREFILTDEDMAANSAAPLWRAIMSRNEAVVKILIGANANLERQRGRRQESPLIFASRMGYEGIARLLLEAGACKDRVDGRASTPLLWAVRNGHEGIVRLLVQAGADIEAVCWRKRTPLHWAMYFENEMIVRLLVEAGANKEASDEFGYMPQDLSSDKDLKQLCRVTSKSARRKHMLFRTAHKAVTTVDNALASSRLKQKFLESHRDMDEN